MKNILLFLLFPLSLNAQTFGVSQSCNINVNDNGYSNPLLAGSVGKKARGVYIGGGEVNCGNGPSYFAYLHSGQTALLAYLRDGSETNTATVRMNYCKPNENLSGNLNQDKTYSVAQSIVSSQNIFDGNIVRYQAGTYVELNDGFYSGDDFVAEINPCVSIITTIASKTEDIGEMELFSNSDNSPNNNIIKIYPTVLASGNGINIQTSSTTDNLDIVIYDLQGKPVQAFNLRNVSANTPTTLPLNSLSANLYIVRAVSNNYSLTQKIIIQ